MDLVKHNPRLKQPVLKMLELAAAIDDRSELEAAAEQAWQPAFSQTPSATIDILVRNGALAETLYLDGIVYEGTLEEAQFDPEVADDAVVEELVEVTQVGRDLQKAYAPEATVNKLWAQKPTYQPIFQAVISACAEGPGATRDALESLIDGFNPTKPDNDRQRVYPQYFLSALEEAGAIQWDGVWRATEPGRALALI